MDNLSIIFGDVLDTVSNWGELARAMTTTVAWFQKMSQKKVLIKLLYAFEEFSLSKNKVLILNKFGEN